MTTDGQFDQGCKRGFPSPKASLYYFVKAHKWLRRPELDLYKLSHLDEFKVHTVDVISAAIIILQRQVIDFVGPFDEAFLCMERILTGAIESKNQAIKSSIILTSVL